MNAEAAEAHREDAWQAWKASDGRYRDSSMTDLRQSFEAGWDALAARLEEATSV